MSICWRHLVTSKESSNPIFFPETLILHQTCASCPELHSYLIPYQQDLLEIHKERFFENAANVQEYTGHLVTTNYHFLDERCVFEAERTTGSIRYLWKVRVSIAGCLLDKCISLLDVPYMGISILQGVTPLASDYLFIWWVSLSFSPFFHPITYSFFLIHVLLCIRGYSFFKKLSLYLFGFPSLYLSFHTITYSFFFYLSNWLSLSLYVFSTIVHSF